MSYTNNNDLSGGCCESPLDQLPDACSNDTRQERLISSQQKDSSKSKIQRFFERERTLIFACVVIGFAMNFTEGQYLLYPFKLFSTWVHEMCHGMAAILTGGYIAKINVFRDFLLSNARQWRF